MSTYLEDLNPIRTSSLASVTIKRLNAHELAPTIVMLANAGLQAISKTAMIHDPPPDRPLDDEEGSEEDF